MITVSSRFSKNWTIHLSRSSRILSTCFILGAITSQYAHAAVTVNFGKDQFFTLGVGVKAQVPIKRSECNTKQFKCRQRKQLTYLYGSTVP